MLLLKQAFETNMLAAAPKKAAFGVMAMAWQ
jgi:hypothetical protein